MSIPDEIQTAHFAVDNLREIFSSRITKSRASGRDGVRLHAFRDVLESEISLISIKVLSKIYQFTPFKERLISRGANRLPRQLSIPTVRDRLALRATCNLLAQLLPDTKTPTPHSYIKSIIETVRRDLPNRSFVRIDVRDFFPSIEHKRLLDLLVARGASPFLHSLIANAISTPTGVARRDGVNSKGVPQGLSISNALPCLYLLELDSSERKCEGEYFRYVDDILIICSSHESVKRLELVDKALRNIGLSAHLPTPGAKTEIKRLDEGIDYLGYHISPKKISVRTSSYRKMFSNLLRVFTSYKYRRDQTKLLFRMNLKITGCIIDGKRRGWLMFFSQTEDISQLRYLDKFVEKQALKSGLSDDKQSIKTFVKTYHEIRFRGDSSKYIPNFDMYNLDNKIELISVLTGVSDLVIRARSIEAIEMEFEKLISKEVSDLEQDVSERFHKSN